MKKLNLLNVKEEDVLNRNEMKSIMAGSGSCNPPCDEDVISCCCGDGRVKCVRDPYECLNYCGI